jgi:hypothetical protein
MNGNGQQQQQTSMPNDDAAGNNLLFLPLELHCEWFACLPLYTQQRPLISFSLAPYAISPSTGIRHYHQ